jgi:hypothetical protein
MKINPRTGSERLLSGSSITARWVVPRLVANANGRPSGEIWQHTEEYL